MPSDLPYLSVVVAARNDAHGGDFLRRMQVFVNGLLEQAKRCRLALELIIVEWNPPPNRPRLSKALTWANVPRTISVRIITVPASIHRRFRYSDKLGMYETITKNVGIRRALGRFVLVTNADLLFSNELIEFLASGKLNSQFVYRIDRHNVQPNVLVNAPIDERIAYCKRHVVFVYTKYGTFMESGLNSRALKRFRSESRFHVRIPPRLYFTVSERVRRRSFMDIKSYRQTWRGRFTRELKRHIRPPYPLLHTGAAGDFTLLARERWFSLRGYPELEMHSLHLDSVFCHMAHRAGLSEFALQDPLRVYHIEHPPGLISSWQIKKLNDALGIPTLSGDQYEGWVFKLHMNKLPPIFNGESWGLGKDRLRETKVYST